MIGTAMLKTNTGRHRQLLALAAMLASLAPAVGQAKDGRDDGDDSSHSIAVAAAGCTELPGLVDAPSARSSGAFTVSGGAAANLLCTVPTDELDTSPGDSPKPVTFQISYLDSDGPGDAVVAFELIRTSLAADPDGFTDTVVCAWSSAAGGAIVGTTSSVVCNTGIVESGFYHLRVSLTSMPGSVASFVGVVASR
jgi:hypothetical protein